MWKANKFVEIFLWIIVAISFLICIYIFNGTSGLDPKVVGYDAIADVINPAFIWMYILLVIIALVTILLPIPDLIKHPKEAKGVAIGLLAFLAVIGLAYALSSPEVLPFTLGHAPVSEDTTVFAEANLYAIYIMIGASALALVGTGVMNFIKSR